MGPLNGFVHMESTSAHQTKAVGDNHGKSKKRNGEADGGASFVAMLQSLVVPNTGHLNAHVPTASDAGATKDSHKVSGGRSIHPKMSSSVLAQYTSVPINSPRSSEVNDGKPRTGFSKILSLKSSLRQSPPGESLEVSDGGEKAGLIGAPKKIQVSINHHQQVLSKHLPVSPEADVRVGPISTGTSKGGKTNTENYAHQIRQALVKAARKPRGEFDINAEISGRVSRDVQQQKADSQLLASFGAAKVTSLVGERKGERGKSTVQNFSSATAKSSGGSLVSKNHSQGEPQLAGLAGLNSSTLATPSLSNDTPSAQTLSLADPSVHTVFQDIVSGQVQSGQQSVTVNIHPEGMGNINIIVNQTNAHHISVQVQASSAQTVQWFNQQKDALSSALQNTGFQLSGFQISYGQGNADQHSRGFLPYRGAQSAKSVDSLTSIDVVQLEDVGTSDSQTRRWFG